MDDRMAVFEHFWCLEPEYYDALYKFNCREDAIQFANDRGLKKYHLTPPISAEVYNYQNGNR